MRTAEKHARITAEREEAQAAYRQRMPHIGDPTMTNAERRAYEECASLCDMLGSAAGSLQIDGRKMAVAVAAAIRAAIPPREEDKPYWRNHVTDSCNNG